MKRAIFLLLFLAILISCQKTIEPEQKKVQIANPASVYCEQHNGTLDIVADNNGSQSGICTLQDGTKCDEWAYFRGDCKEKPKVIAEKPSEKFLIHFPWAKGEAWEFTTDFHDEGALDFAYQNSQDKKAVLAAADGEVIYAVYSYADDFNTYNSREVHELQDLGNFVILKHNGVYTLYTHLSNEKTPPIIAGDKIKAGTIIGYQGNTGWSHGAHLHFSVVKLNFIPYLDFVPVPRDSWGFIENGNSNKLNLYQKYVSQNEKEK